MINIQGRECYEHVYLDNSPKVSFMKKAIPDFLQDPQLDVMLIQGEAGTGKSTFMHYLEHIQWIRFNRGESAYLPVYINLSTVRKTSDLMESALSQFGGSSL